jgi:NNP family nitrate/nitrite transporter-like MFS transporter
MAVDLNQAKATRIELFSLSTPQMQAFHMTWLAFFVCFFAWFATAPLMPIIAKDLTLSKDQVYNITIAGVFATILARMAIGPLCESLGPRITYTLLLVLGSIPVFLISLAWDYASFLTLRLFIGVIGASFVVTQYHTSVMFAPNVVGTANATVGGWGNAGGGATQTLMPLLTAAIAGFGFSQTLSWRAAVVTPGVLMLVVAALYWRFTQDTPQGNVIELRRKGVSVDAGKKGGWSVMKAAARNYRVWILAASYGASFGVELFVHSIAVTYFFNRFSLSVEQAGYAVGAFGLLALFARALGGILSDRIAGFRGLDARVWMLAAMLLFEGGLLIAFSQTNVVALAVFFLLAFGLFTHMACGSLYALVPFIDRSVLGGVAGIIGAGGNIGGVAAGFLLRGIGNVQTCFLILGYAAVACAVAAVFIRFSSVHKTTEQALYDEAIARRLAAYAKDGANVRLGTNARA